MAENNTNNLDVDALGQELYEATVESFNKELAKNVPAQKLAESFAGVVADFFAGYKEGIQQELQVWKEENGMGTIPANILDESILSDDSDLKILEEIRDILAKQNITGGTDTEILEVLKETSELHYQKATELLVKQEQLQKQMLESQNESTKFEKDQSKETNKFQKETTKSQKDQKKESEKQTTLLSDLQLERSEKISRETLKKRDLESVEKGSFYSSVKKFGIGFAGGLLPGEKGSKWAEQKAADMDEREEYIKAETKLRAEKDPEGFGVLSKVNPEEAKKRLNADFTSITKDRKQLREIETKLEKLRESGYSEEQLKTIASEDLVKRNTLTESISSKDSRFDYLKEKTKQEKDQPEYSSEEQLPVPMNESNDFNSFNETNKTSETLSVLDLQNQLNESNTSSNTEEMMLEETVVRKNEFEEVKTQTGLLGEVVELLKEQNKLTEENIKNAPAEQGGGILDMIPDMLPGRGGKPTPNGKPGGKPGMLSKAKSLLGSPKALGIGAGALAVAGGAYTAYTGFKDAGEQTKTKMAELEQLKESGQITAEEYEKQKATLIAEDTENKGGALGSGAGMAAGGLAGMKAGALLGSFAGPIGTVVGGAAGGIIGGIAGSGVGKNIGGAIGKGWNWLTGKSEPDNKLSTQQNTDPEALLVQSAIQNKQLEEKSQSLKSIETKSNEMVENNEKNIIVQAPPPVVIPQPASSGGSSIVSQPFSQIMKQDEPSISSYIRRRYVPA